MSSPKADREKPRGGKRFAHITGNNSSARITFDGELSSSDCKAIFLEMCSNVGAKDSDDRDELLYQLAAVYATGTSAERNMSEIAITVNDAVYDMLIVEGDAFDGHGDSARRKFCRGHQVPDADGNEVPFADFVFEVIQEDIPLRKRLANMSICTEDMAPFSFDFADRMSIKQTGNQRRFVHENKVRKVGVSRSEFVAESVMADAYHIEKHMPASNKKSDTFNPAARTTSMFGH